LLSPTATSTYPLSSTQIFSAPALAIKTDPNLTTPAITSPSIYSFPTLSSSSFLKNVPSRTPSSVSPPLSSSVSSISLTSAVSLAPSSVSSNIPSPVSTPVYSQSNQELQIPPALPLPSDDNRDLFPPELDDKGNTLCYRLVHNDRTSVNLIDLIHLKNIFSRQLPKMPKPYIVRLVFDRQHRSLCIVKNKKIIGGICYRPFSSQRFAEIVF